MDISNKTLAIFLVLAIIISLSGTIISLNIITKQVGPTAFATSQAGQVNFTILSATDISVQNSTVDFGAGVVNISVANCTFADINNQDGNNSNETWNPSFAWPAEVYRGCWVNDTWYLNKPAEQSAVPINTSRILIQNDGNVNISLTFASSKNNASSFIGNCSTEDHTWYMYNVSNAEATSCPASRLGGAGSSWINVTTGSLTTCTMLNWVDATDSVKVSFRLRICKSLRETGAKLDTLTFTSAAA